MTDIVEHRLCRACKGLLQEILNLGAHRLNGFPKHAWEIETFQRVPLVLTACTGCGLVQLDRTVPPDWLYRKYWYRSGVNETMVAELEAIVREAGALVALAPTDRVLDIGANDGTLLAHYQKIFLSRRPIRYAAEPALNLRGRLQPHCDVLLNDYFPVDGLEETRFKIITAIACAYDTEDPCAFFQGIADLLAPDGVAIVQFQDFGQQLASAAFDNVCHEHLLYYTLWSLLHIVKRVGLDVVKVASTHINGGSLRVVLAHAGARPVDSSVAFQLSYEATAHLDTPSIRQGDLTAFTRFARKVHLAKAQIGATLLQAFNENRVVDVYGASTKGNILLQVLGIGPSLVRQAIDRSPEKVGCLTITGVPIVSEVTARTAPADLWLCPIWGFRESVLARERWYLEQGGRILFPLPVVEIVGESWKLPTEVVDGQP